MEKSPIYPTMSADEKVSFEGFRQEVLQDYGIACTSREASLLGRKEVLTGKAKFGIFGDGKEVAQVAVAKFFKPGDFRSGYYRDQTFVMALGEATVAQFFSQLYADTDTQWDPFSGGRQMVNHYATQLVNEQGEWLDIVNRKNVLSDIAPTAGQMPRSLGIAFASKLFRQVEELQSLTGLSNNGNEICFCTIGDASTSEGHFWETMNAAGVLQVPLAVFVWDDGYGISVPKSVQTTKGSISNALSGLQKEENTNGIDIYRLKGWDYAGMCEVLSEAIEKIRRTHTPALFHIEEITQPQGHSTSGSHERYKSSERLVWEREWDGLKKMREWILENALASEEELDEIEAKSKQHVKESRQLAWEHYITPIKERVSVAVSQLEQVIAAGGDPHGKIAAAVQELQKNREPLHRDIHKVMGRALTWAAKVPAVNQLKALYDQWVKEGESTYAKHLYNEGAKSALQVPVVPATFDASAANINGYEVLNQYFDQLFATNSKVVAFGEDVGFIGDVNQGFAGLQQKHGALRISDTGIRELTIMGQGMGLALRGLRPIAEIQYLDYLLYGLQPLSDDAATTHWRTNGMQSCPIIVRSRGHRLEGVWHSGSPMGMIINSLRGFHICVPRNMVQAVGMYNTLLQSNDPALMIECLNGYRLKEKLPQNLLAYTVPLGIPEVVRTGADITIVSYGSTLRIVEEAAEILAEQGIDCEIVDVQTLLPFDIHHQIVESLKKTNRILFVDEDVPGGAAAFMFTKVMEEQGGYRWLDVAPKTLTGKAHRPAYGSDGDYFSKPNVEDVLQTVLTIMAE